MAKKIVITSGKGGVGKTTVCCNLGVQLARRGLRVLICDLDFGLNNVDVALGIENMVSYDVIDAIEGKCRARQTLVKHPRYPTLYALGSNRIPKDYVSPQAVKVVLEALSPQFDFMLIDSPAGIDEGFHRAVNCADEALIVTTPRLFSMRDADRVFGILQSYRIPEVGLVVNMMRSDLLKRGETLTAEEISASLRLPVRAVIEEDDRLLLESVCERSRAFRLLSEYYACPPRRGGVIATWGNKQR